MRRLFLAAIGTILVSTATIQPALANKTSANFNATQSQVTKNATPFQLVNLAYRGQLKGLAGYNSLLNALKFGDIDGKDVVQHGIDSGRLSPETIDNSGYIAVVDQKLQNLLRD